MGLETLLEGESPVVRGQEQSKTFRRRSANVHIQKCILTLFETLHRIVH